MATASGSAGRLDRKPVSWEKILLSPWNRSERSWVRIERERGGDSHRASPLEKVMHTTFQQIMHMTFQQIRNAIFAGVVSMGSIFTVFLVLFGLLMVLPHLPDPVLVVLTIAFGLLGLGLAKLTVRHKETR